MELPTKVKLAACPSHVPVPRESRSWELVTRTFVFILPVTTWVNVAKLLNPNFLVMMQKVRTR